MHRHNDDSVDANLNADLAKYVAVIRMCKKRWVIVVLASLEALFAHNLNHP